MSLLKMTVIIAIAIQVMVINDNDNGNAIEFDNEIENCEWKCE